VATVFFIINLPGLVTLLMLTVRVARAMSGAPGAGSVRQVLAYLRRNARTMTALCVGFTCSASVNWGIGAWLQAFFVRTHGWSVAEAGALQGALTMGLGPIGTLLGGWLADRYARRGMIDAPLRIGMLGAAGMIVFAGLYPVVPSATLAAALLVPVNLFAALPWGAANAAIAEAMPSRMRGQGSAIFQLMVGLAGGMARRRWPRHRPCMATTPALVFSPVVTVVGMSLRSRSWPGGPALVPPWRRAMNHANARAAAVRRRCRKAYVTTCCRRGCRSASEMPMMPTRNAGDADFDLLSGAAVMLRNPMLPGTRNQQGPAPASPSLPKVP
jgi:hypothetical protein